MNITFVDKKSNDKIENKSILEKKRIIEEQDIKEM